MKQVSSRDNPEYRRLSRLAQGAGARREGGSMVLDGIHLLQAYLAAFGPRELELCIRGSMADDPEIQPLIAACAGRGVVLSDRLFDAAAPHEAATGVLGIAPIPTLQQPPSLPPDRLLILIDGVQDPGNLGSIIRSAAAAGAWAAWVGEGSADPWSPKCLRGGMGAHFRLPVRSRVDLPVEVGKLPQRVLAADSGEGESIYETDLSGPLALAVGAEGRGISPRLLGLASIRVRIPMEPGLESLNAAAAAAVILFEWRRRRAG